MSTNWYDAIKKQQDILEAAVSRERDIDYSAKYDAEGVAAPLEPTRGFCIRHGYGNSLHEKQDACVNWWAEGVAPLEPSAPEFAQQMVDCIENYPGILNMRDFFAERLSTYAAAVSKNIQEELALTKRVLLQHMNGDDYEMSLAGLYAKLTEND
jgi:hypothetical protein